MVGPEVTTADPGPRLFDRAHRLTTAGVLMLVTFIAFESMAVGTAMPTAVRELHGLAWYAWPFSAFLVSSVIGMVVGGDVGDRRGARVALPWGVAAFGAGLLTAGLATSMAVFIGGRVVQGLGAGVIIVLVYVIVGQAFEPGLRPRLFGAMSAAWVLPALVGPLAAGLLTTHASWRWVFLGLLPLIVLGLLLVLPSVRRLTAPAGATSAAHSGRPWSAVLAGVGIGALQYAGQRRDLLALVVAIAGAVLLVVGLRPLLPIGAVRAARGLPAVIASRGLLAGAFFGMDALLPLTLTAVHGFSATAAGVPLTAGALGWAVASHLQGRIPDFPRDRLLRIGFVVLAVGLAATTLAAVPRLGGWSSYASWAVAGLGMGLGMPSLGVLLLDQSPEHRRGADSAALQIADVTASALTVGAAGVLVAAATAGVLSIPTAVLGSIGLFTALALLGVYAAGRTAAPVPQEGAEAPASSLATS